MAVESKLSGFESPGPDPLVFVHGWCGDGSHFEPQIEAFADRYGAFAPDLPWHGSSGSEGEISIASFAESVGTFMDERQLKDALLIGHSMGGMVVVKLADMRPDLVRGIVILDSAYAMHDDRRLGLQTLLPILRGPGRAAAMSELAEGLFEPTDDLGLRKRVADQMIESDPKLQAEGLGAMLEFITGEGDKLFSELEVPVASVLATQAPSDFARLCALKPEALVGQVISAGHYLQLFAPSQVNAMIEDFIAKGAAIDR